LQRVYITKLLPFGGGVFAAGGEKAGERGWEHELFLD
jgi:hypothetical protein